MRSTEINLFKMSNERLERLGELYRALCFEQGNDILMRGESVVTFKQFVQDHQAAEMIEDTMRERFMRSLRRCDHVSIGYLRMI